MRACYCFESVHCENALGWNLVLVQRMNATEEWNSCECLRDFTQDFYFLVTGRSAKFRDLIRLFPNIKVYTSIRIMRSTLSTLSWMTCKQEPRSAILRNSFSRLYQCLAPQASLFKCKIFFGNR